MTARFPNGQFAPADWQPIHSSNLEAATQTDHGLYVRFRGGATYRYRDVPFDVLAELAAAAPENDVSAGHLLHVKVKQPGYAYERVA